VAKIPYFFRRKNNFYFRARIPFEHWKTFKAKEKQVEAIPLVLKYAANLKANLHDIETGKKCILLFPKLQLSSLYTSLC
jgi:hypothetical protein